MRRSFLPALAVAGLAFAAAPAHAYFTLVDSSGLEFFVYDSVTSVSYYSSYSDITYFFFSSASGSATDATYTAAVPSTTSGGGTYTTTLGDAFDGYNGITVNGKAYYNNGAATPSTACDGREYVFGTQTIDGLEVFRRFFVPADDEFARWITVVTNPGSEAAAVELKVVSNLGSDSDTVVLATASGDTTIDTADTWFATGGDYDDPRVAHILGNGMGPVAVASVMVGEFQDDLIWTYDFTVEPGQTVSIINYVSGQPTNADAVAAGSYYEGLSGSTLACLTADDWATVGNFGIDCSAEDGQCVAGAFDPSTGACTAVPANEGGSCDDGDECTLDDVCSAGECAGTVDPECGDDSGSTGDDGGTDSGTTGDDGGTTGDDSTTDGLDESGDSTTGEPEPCAPGCEDDELCFEGQCYPLDDCTQQLGVPCDEVPQGYLKASAPQELAFFGRAAAVDGDTLVVGALSQSDPAGTVPHGGMVYVFTRTEAGWQPEAELAAPNADEGDWFGCSVALDGSTLVVGALQEGSAATGIDGDASDDSAGSSGAVYVFERGDAGWALQAYVKASNTDTSDGFGGAVDLDGDTLVVGATHESSASAGVGGDEQDDSLGASGAVYVFVRSGGTWAQQAYIKAGYPGEFDLFGADVAVDGDTLVVGASIESLGGSGVDASPAGSLFRSGAAYVYERSGTQWSQVAYLKAEQPEYEAHFGSWVAVDGDTLAVAATQDDGPADVYQAGAVHVYQRVAGQWGWQATLQPDVIDPYLGFGSSLDLAGDTVVAGAFGESSSVGGLPGDPLDEGASSSGAAYVFERVGTGWSQRAYVKAIDPEDGDTFGSAIATDGSTLVVGAQYEDGSGPGVEGDPFDNGVDASGAAFVYRIAP
ncbi:MAG: hypothetical protein KDK70_04625 [Myxococcales bacterium]|nr:hypothetical protein [Myxococcales bacterium]